MSRRNVALPGDSIHLASPRGDLDGLLSRITQLFAARPRREIPLDGFRAAAVVIPLCETPQGLSVLFTVRTSLVEQHKGEISFPGGRVDPEDDGTLTAALREAEEEVGLRAHDLRLLGCLDDFVSTTGYRVTPYVMHLSRPDYQFRPAPQEVDQILLIPLPHLLDPAHHRASAQKDSPWLVHYFHWEPHVIWGLTAAILKRFLDIAFDYSGGP